MYKVIYHHSVFITIYIIIFLLGVYCYSKLKIQLTPETSPSNIYITISDPGSKSNLIEKQVTKPIEEILSNIDGLKSIVTFSEHGKSKIDLSIRSDKNINNSINEVRDIISKNKSLLPKSIKEPIISKDNFSDKPLIYVSIKSSDNKSISDSLISDIKQKLKYVEGHSKLSISGNKNKALYINILLDKFIKYDISLDKLLNQISLANLELAGGKNRNNYTNEQMSFDKITKSVNDFENITINNLGLKLGNISKIELSDQPEMSYSYVDGKKVLLLGFFAKSTINPVDYYNNIKLFLKNYTKNNPDIKFKIIIDNTKDISKSFNSTAYTIVETIISVSFIIFIVIGKLRYALIVLLTIPISLAGCFITLYLCNYTINNITMMAIILAIGLAVDDSIIVIEKSVFYYDEKKLSALKSIFKAILELFTPVLTLMLILIVIYIPSFFIYGDVGKILQEFSVTIISCLIISFLVSFTLTPSLFLKLAIKTKKNNVNQFVDKLFKDIIKIYILTLINFLRNIKFFLFLSIILIMAGFYIAFTKINVEIEPFEKKDLIVLQNTFSPNSNLNYIHYYMYKIFNILSRNKNIDSSIVIEESPQSMMWFNLKDRLKSEETLRDINKELSHITVGGQVSTKINQSKNVNNISGKYKLHFYIANPKSIKTLHTTTSFMSEKMNKVFEDFHIITPSTSQDISIICDDKKLSKYGFTQKDFADKLDIFLNHRKLDTFEKDNSVYDILIRLDDSFSNDFSQIESINIKTSHKETKYILFRDVCKITKTNLPSYIFRFNQQFAVEGYVITKPNISLSEAIDFIERLNNEVNNGSSIFYSAETQNLIDLSKFYPLFIFISILGLYLLIYAKFNNILLPLIVLGSIPVCISFSFLPLYYINGTLNIYTTLALVTLIGLMAKHNILLCTSIYKYSKTRSSLIRSIISGSKLRIRAILITSTAITISLVSLLFDNSNYSNSRFQLSIFLLSGILIGSFITVYITPALYYLIFRKK